MVIRGSARQGKRNSLRPGEGTDLRAVAPQRPRLATSEARGRPHAVRRGICTIWTRPGRKRASLFLRLAFAPERLPSKGSLINYLGPMDLVSVWTARFLGVNFRNMRGGGDVGGARAKDRSRAHGQKIARRLHWRVPMGHSAQMHARA